MSNEYTCVVCLQVELCDPHLSALEVSLLRFSRRGAIQIYVYLYVYLYSLQTNKQIDGLDILLPNEILKNKNTFH